MVEPEFDASGSLRLFRSSSSDLGFTSRFSEDPSIMERSSTALGNSVRLSFSKANDVVKQQL